MTTLVTVDLNRTNSTPLCLFTYNVGKGRAANSTLLKKLNRATAPARRNSLRPGRTSASTRNPVWCRAARLSALFC